MAEIETKEKDTANEAVSVDDLCLLANSFAENGQLEKAIQVYETASKIFPDNLALKINLGRVKNLNKQKLESPHDFMLQNQFAGKDRDLWANRYQGLGEIFLKNGQKAEARQVFEMSKVSNPNYYLPYLNLGRMYLEEGALSQAILELEKARKLNPFNEETVDLLSAAYYQQRDYREALECAVDAFIISGEVARQRGGKYRPKIKAAIEKIHGFSSKMRNDLIRKRRQKINAVYEELAEEFKKIVDRRQVISNPPGASETKKAVVPVVNEKTFSEAETKKAYEIAAALRKHLIFRNMDDEAVLKIARFTSAIHVMAGDFVYQENDPIYGLYLISKGKVEIQRSTPFGPLAYVKFEKGSFFGDDNLLSGRERVNSAHALEDTEMLFLDKAGLATIFAREKTLAIHFLWYFWKSLSFQIRESNDRMTHFFAGTSEDAKKEILAKTVPGGVPTHIEIDKKLEVLQTKGLSSKELTQLARLSNEEMYNEGETIFSEGDPGDRLYIVLEGTVLISKRIPGVGEEALAVLKQGDFFGEMALVGQSHQRSADAKATVQGTTVLVVTRDALREILAIDTESAYQFLTILCRILSQRLLEMNEKLYQWKMMSGTFS